MGDVTCVRTYTVKNQAELAKMNLEASGVKAELAAEDAGGMAPHFIFFQGGIRLMVRTEDLSKAVEILKRGEHHDKGLGDKSGDAASRSECFFRIMNGPITLPWRWRSDCGGGYSVGVAAAGCN